jgi:hypothetical protein
VLIRVGSCEAEVRVCAVMSTPRLGFTDNFFCVHAALTPHQIPVIKHTGVFFGQCLTRSIESVIDKYDAILAIDYDTVFTGKTVEALVALLMHSGVDAIAPLQTKRESQCVMFALPGVKPEDQTTVEGDWFKKPVQLVETAHFGCTLIRTEAIKKMEKPWFLATPNESGDWNGGHIDEDISWWKNFAKAGNKLGLATNISVGHAELMITWPSRTEDGGKVQQHTTEFWNGGQMPPESAWGIIK